MRRATMALSDRSLASLHCCSRILATSCLTAFSAVWVLWRHEGEDGERSGCQAGDPDRPASKQRGDGREADSNLEDGDRDRGAVVVMELLLGYHGERRRFRLECPRPEI